MAESVPVYFHPDLDTKHPMLLFGIELCIKDNTPFIFHNDDPANFVAVFPAAMRFVYWIDGCFGAAQMAGDKAKFDELIKGCLMLYGKIHTEPKLLFENNKIQLNNTL